MEGHRRADPRDPGRRRVLARLPRSATRRHAPGGGFEAPDNRVDASGYAFDGDRWRSGGDLSGYRSGVDWLGDDTLIAVGPTGSDVSYDGARRWRAFDSAPYDAVDCVRRACWASGPAGAVAVLR